MAIKIKIAIGILTTLVGSGLLYLYFLFSPVENAFFPKCIFHSLTGWYCPGCGSQRALHAFLHGHIIEGLSHNMLIALTGIVLVYDITVIAIKQTFNKPLKNILHYKLTTQLILVVVILFWVLRNIKTYPFTILAP